MMIQYEFTNTAIGYHKNGDWISLRTRSVLSFGRVRSDIIENSFDPAIWPSHNMHDASILGCPSRRSRRGGTISPPLLVLDETVQPLYTRRRALKSSEGTAILEGHVIAQHVSYLEKHLPETLKLLFHLIQLSIFLCIQLQIFVHQIFVHDFWRDFW